MAMLNGRLVVITRGYIHHGFRSTTIPGGFLQREADSLGTRESGGGQGQGPTRCVDCDYDRWEGAIASEARGPFQNGSRNKADDLWTSLRLWGVCALVFQRPYVLKWNYQLILSVFSCILVLVGSHPNCVELWERVLHHQMSSLNFLFPVHYAALLHCSWRVYDAEFGMISMIQSSSHRLEQLVSVIWNLAVARVSVSWQSASHTMPSNTGW